MDATPLSSFFDRLIESVNADPVKLFTILGTTVSTISMLIFLFGAIFTVIQIRAARKARLNAALSHVFAQLSEHNNQTVNDPYRRMAVEQFSRLSIPVADEKGNPHNSEELSKLYWGARAFHIGLINLLAQVWLLSGRPRRLEGNYEGWESLARAVVGDLTGKTSASKPDWYRNACTDLWGPIEQNRVYPRGFANGLKRVAGKFDERQSLY
jgi:hypothetical protein